MQLHGDSLVGMPQGRADRCQGGFEVMEPVDGLWVVAPRSNSRGHACGAPLLKHPLDVGVGDGHGGPVIADHHLVGQPRTTQP